MPFVLDILPPSLSTTLLRISEGGSDSVLCMNENPYGFGERLKWFDLQGEVAPTIVGIASTTLLLVQVRREEAGIYQCVYTRDRISVTSNLTVVVECK